MFLLEPTKGDLMESGTRQNRTG